ncbi:MAG: hypothetical protein ACRBB6_04400 [Neptuniibacter sp.]
MEPIHMDRMTYLETRIAILETHLDELLRNITSSYQPSHPIHQACYNARMNIDSDTGMLVQHIGEKALDSYQLLERWRMFNMNKEALMGLIQPKGTFDDNTT